MRMFDARRLTKRARYRAVVVSLALLTGVVMAGGPTNAAAADERVVVVGPGQSIQAAVDTATAGTTIEIQAGVYHQIVNVTASGITIKGSGSGAEGTVLDFRGAAPHGRCDVSAICVFASRVRVTGVRAVHYPNAGVNIQGSSAHTTTVRVDHDVFVDDFIGVVSAQATDVTVEDIQATTTGFGVLIYGGPGYSQADTVVLDSSLIGAIFGVSIGDAHNVTIEGLRLSGNCQGLFAFDDNAGGGTGEIEVRNNRVSANNRLCPPTPYTFDTSFQGGGIILLGATRSSVIDNTVNSNIGNAINSGGITVASSAPFFGGANPDGDIVQRNHAMHNQPADIIWDGSGADVRFHDNDCATSISSPTGAPVGTTLCAHETTTTRRATQSAIRDTSPGRSGGRAV